MRHDVLADVFSILKNTEEYGKKEAIVPFSSLAENVLKMMQEHQYIGTFSRKDRKISVQLIGRINKCNVIRPRFSVKSGEFIKWEKRFLPANNIGILILSTTKGVMDHQQAKKDRLGGQLLGYVY